MSYLNYLITLIAKGVIKFVSVVILGNRDYPYHDYQLFEDTDEPVAYVVGTNQTNLRGDQKKKFVSKSTLIYSDVACTIRLNHETNVALPIVANTWYTFESNIHTLIVSVIAEGGFLHAYFEGVLPQESRSPK